MAVSLTELQTLLNHPELRDKVRAAVVITAKNVNFESGSTDNHAARLVWAKSVFNDPNGMADKVVRYVVAANSDATDAAAILALTDAQIQPHVDAAVNIFAVS